MKPHLRAHRKTETISLARIVLQSSSPCRLKTTEAIIKRGRPVRMLALTQRLPGMAARQTSQGVQRPVLAARPDTIIRRSLLRRARLCSITRTTAMGIRTTFGVDTMDGVSIDISSERCAA